MGKAAAIRQSVTVAGPTADTASRTASAAECRAATGGVPMSSQAFRDASTLG
jgi:hypothetical protein